MKNKGNVGSLMPIITVLILVGILAGAGITIMASMQDATRMPATVTVANESGKIWAGHEVLDQYGVARGFRNAAIVEIYNGTGKVAAGNYTFDSATATLTRASTYDFNSSKITYTYTTDADTAASNGTEDALNSIGDLTGDWIPIIVIVFAAGVVIAVLLGAFSQKRH